MFNKFPFCFSFMHIINVKLIVTVLRFLLFLWCFCATFLNTLFRRVDSFTLTFSHCVSLSCFEETLSKMHLVCYRFPFIATSRKLANFKAFLFSNTNLNLILNNTFIGLCVCMITRNYLKLVLAHTQKLR